MSDSEVSVDVESVVSLRKNIYEEARDSLPAEASCHQLQTCHEHPHRMLEVVPTLELADGTSLQAVVYCDTNGWGRVWRQPPVDAADQFEGAFWRSQWSDEGAPSGRLGIPEPKTIETSFETMAGDVMSGIRGDGSPRSYVDAFVLALEYDEFGRRWHACHWADHDILTDPPRDVVERTDWASTSSDIDWPGAPVAVHIRPETSTIEVELWTYIGHMPERIVRHKAKFVEDSYVPDYSSEVVSKGSSGYIH